MDSRGHGGALPSSTRQEELRHVFLVCPPRISPSPSAIDLFLLGMRVWASLTSVVGLTVFQQRQSDQGEPLRMGLWLTARASGKHGNEEDEAQHRLPLVFSPNEEGEGGNAFAGVGPEGYTRRADGVIIGPDGKPCRACNTKSMFAAAMKGAGIGTGSPQGKASVLHTPSTPSSGGGPLGSDKPRPSAARSGSAAGSETNETPELPACPPDGPSIGNSTWTFLHSAAAFYPDTPNDEQQTAMRNLIQSLSLLYPCAPCAYGLKKHLEKQQEKRSSLGDQVPLTKPHLLAGRQDDPGTLSEAARSGRAMRAWLCAAHNEVNSRLGKPLFSCTDATLDARWGDGPTDGSCEDV